ncbi:hypothetical protein PSN45_005103 [Yamadazyma tenuis]|uniref:Pyridoxamine 5'-phosphate oxidase N-terminal domain-containing protein n=1 Tax=Candida tenuis (strain ATCC 10573 / BCRC 21748 / CBS 615 / JCM 9827 / NBRC 10315 / NRRL Y-1498 / VKM Y-70) TaxID=590646 RepID=G3B2T6_CANTC|nr:uncharacterized protein CANTEDRAFT_113534 [Yamadazyma tenuis ATCC 10573]EGV64758.1 hypothetical protein CANTEDRAFT_113534 [Yamadazyma tenuis ATCC 10573]WEJ97548.1 hypothetical protein PSN45_005103 [Yamadazyma tenuis]
MLPESATKLLKSTRFLHLATSYQDVPHVSLMNYTFYQDNGDDYVIITTPANTTKYHNIKHNHRVSMLVHDWISAKPDDGNSSSGTSTGRRNSLYDLITNLNKTQLSSVSVMVDGEAEIVPESDGRHKFYHSLHMNNQNIDTQQLDNYVKADTTELIVVKVTGCKITDTDNNVVEY